MNLVIIVNALLLECTFNKTNKPLSLQGFFYVRKTMKYFLKQLSKIALDTEYPQLISEIKHLQQQQKIWVYSNPDSCFLALKPVYRVGQLTLFIWVGISANQDGLAKVMPKIEAMAKATDCYFVEFVSTRKGFKRVAEKMGYYPVKINKQFTTYRKEVSGDG